MALDPLLTVVGVLLIVPISLFLGVIYSFLLRKITARFQWRVGPMVRMYSDLAPILGKSRILQPLYDVLKLFGKETLVPDVPHKGLFKSAPYLSLAFAVLAVFFIPFPGLPLLSEVPFSMIIASYLIIAAVMFTVIGPAASGSPWGAIGARREAELFLIAELAFVVSLFSVAYAQDTLTLWNLASNIGGLLNFILFAVAGILMFLAMLGKLHIKPFDIPEAETEIVAGPYTEYSGKYLGMFFLTRVFLFYGLIGLFVAVFLPPISSSLLWLPLYAVAAVLLVFLLSAIHTLSPRYRIDTALISYSKLVIALGIASFAIALVFRLVI